MPDERPLHRQARDRIRAVALAQPLGERAVIPAEPHLSRVTGASRGTVRKAVDSLVAEGLLVREHGRGTFVDPGAQIRRLVADRLATVAKPDSRFDDDFESFIPDFEGSDICAATIADLPEYARAATVFVARDNNLQPLRQRVLEDRKRLVVPSHALRTGLRLIESVPPGMERFASVLDGVDDFAVTVPLERTGEIGPVSIAATGAVAVTREGVMFGARHDYFRVETAVLAATGALSDEARMIGDVHDCQVVDLSEDADVLPGVLDLVITPTTHFECAGAGPARDAIDPQMLDTVPGLRELLTPF